MTQWASLVAKNLDTLLAENSEASRSVVTLFELVSEYQNGGLVQYLMNDSANSLGDVRRTFLQAGFLPGLAWLEEVERTYGGPISLDRDARIDKISTLPGFEEGIDPFDAQHQLLARLLPEIDKLAEAAVKQTSIWRG